MLQQGQGAGAELSEQSDRRERDAGVFRAEWSSSRRRNRLVVIHDAAYAALVFEGKPLSFLATPGAKEVGMELHSTSKSFNMTGWRCGFVAGNELLVRAYGDVKDNTDSGQFLAIQHAAAYCFDHPEITRANRRQVFPAHERAGGGAAPRPASRPRKPKGSFFLYVKAPKAAVQTAAAHGIQKRGGSFAMAHHARS